MIEEIEEGKYWRGKYLLFEDKGPVSQGAKTRLYKLSGQDGSFLGYVKWKNTWRRYVSFLNDCIIDENCHLEMAEFLRDRNKEYKEGWPTRSIVDWEKVLEYEKKLEENDKTTV